MQGSFKWVAGETVMWKWEDNKLNWVVHPPREVKLVEQSLIQSRVEWRVRKEVRKAEEEAKSYYREPQWWKPDME
jgi:hypothetical protein